MSLPVIQCALDSLFSADQIVSGNRASVVSGAALDSRLLQRGDLYLALAGRASHGLLHIADAIEKGAVAVVAGVNDWAQHPDAVVRAEAAGLARVAVEGDVSRLAPEIADAVYATPASRLFLIGVTGTDGKTSVCRFISEALSAAGRPCGYIGTVGWGMGERLRENALTTPDVIMLRRMLFELAAEGATHVAFEASSHALAEGRLEGLDIRVAVLTNFGRDHLDYHGSIEAYREAKAMLFAWPTLEAMVVNVGDAFGRSLLASAPESVERWGFDSHDQGALSDQSALAAAGVNLVCASDIESRTGGLAFTLHDGDARTTVDSRLFGRFNVDNLLACHGVLRAAGVAANEAVHALSSVRPVAGRMEVFRPGDAGGPLAVVDYSHTPQSLAAAIDALRPHCAGELWVVFGCGGDRDPGKRAPMAAAAAAGDRVIVTDDNPRTESSAAIIADILDGFSSDADYIVIADRGEAIDHALDKANEADVVLIAGKGHEDYQIIGHEKRPFSDRDTVAAILREAS
ncbi:MAG: UDP-N-acetylmuramoyl-L-alanyl-D-glutamate--2,6-diaminopimelate ligase [Gammaproteobacteria bacterium]|nr:MAG: UDP-N-acetylmuramoyl-L-alanyl-D-glutamate--2,6-diaminopimelate ligase [Gammaproteobacteria bacterium]